jgi:hypothetical protein
MEAVRSSETSLNFWLHGVTFQKLFLFIVIAVTLHWLASQVAIYVGFKVLTEVTVLSAWDVKPWCLVEVSRRFEWT